MTPTKLRWLRVAAALAAVAFVVGLRLLQGTTLEVFDNLAQVASALVAGVACLRAAPKRPSAERAWRLLGCSALSWGLGQAVWSWLELVLGVFPFPSLADAGFLASYPLAVLAMLAFPAAPTLAASRVRLLLDGVIVTTSLLFCSWALVLGPVYEASSGTLLEKAMTLAYPFGDLLIAAIVVLVLTRSAPDQRVPLAMIGAGLLATAVVDSAFAVLVINGTYATGNLVDLGWVAGYLLIALAAAEPAGGATRSDVDAGPAPLWHVVLPYVPLCGVLAVAIARRVLGYDVGIVLFWLAAVLFCALAARQLAALMENRALVANLRSREAQLTHLAFHDPLTGLANRALFGDRVTHALERRGRTSPVAVLFYDLDDFKIVNDSFGHHAGDLLLMSVAVRLRDCARQGDTVARLGGDEFALLLEELSDPSHAVVVARRMLALSDTPFRLGDHEVTLTGSVGIALEDTATTSAETLLGNADIAMYVAKARGKSRHTTFEPGMRARVLERLNLSRSLEKVGEPY